MNLFNLLGANEGGLFSGSNLTMILVLVALMVVMFAVSFIPQRKRQKKAQEMMNNISVGTKVKTIGGFVGEVKKIDNGAGTFTLDISANGDGSTMVIIDKSAIYTVLQAVQTQSGETTLKEKEEKNVVAMDDIEADEAAAQKKADRKVKKSEGGDSKNIDAPQGDSLEKKDNNTLLKD